MMNRVVRVVMTNLCELYQFYFRVVSHAYYSVTTHTLKLIEVYSIRPDNEVQRNTGNVKQA
jgi:hypothetical protein